MDVSKVFAEISSHQVEGMMFHNDMADYFDFLGLMGFKRLHEYQFLEESACMRGVHRYFINHFNKLLEVTNVKSDSHIPNAWYGYTRQEVDVVAKKNAIQSCTEKWVEWERSTKQLYEKCYKDLCEIGEVAAAMKVGELVKTVDCELKCADRLHIELKSVDYDLGYIFFMQDALHEEYRNKSKEIGVDIC